MNKNIIIGAGIISAVGIGYFMYKRKESKSISAAPVPAKTNSNSIPANTAVTNNPTTQSNCAAPSITGIPTMANGQIGIPWSSAFNVKGLPPFTLSNINKPSWVITEMKEPTPGSGDWFVTMFGHPNAAGSTIPI